MLDNLLMDINDTTVTVLRIVRVVEWLAISGRTAEG